MALLAQGSMFPFSAGTDGATVTLSVNGGCVASWSGAVSGVIGPVPGRIVVGPLNIGQSVVFSADIGSCMLEFGDATPNEFGNATNAVIDSQGRLVGPGGVVLDVAAAQERIDGEVWQTNQNGGVTIVILSNNGFWKDLSGGADVLSFGGRTLLGEAKNATANRNGSQGSWVPDSATGANWALRDSQALCMSTNGLIAVTGFSKSSLQNDAPKECIGVAGFVIHDATGPTQKAWALYGDVQAEASAVGASYGCELAVKNKGANKTFTPYTGGDGVYGLWLQGGGDSSYGGVAANPNTAAVAVVSGGSTWNVGFVTRHDALTRNKVANTQAVAINMAMGHRIEWERPDGVAGPAITSTTDSGQTPVKQTFEANGIRFQEEVFGGSHFLFTFSATGSANANGIRLRSSAANAAPSVEAFGTDANADLKLLGKGSGVLQFGSHTPSSDVACNGFITIKDAAGNVRKLMTTA